MPIDPQFVATTLADLVRINSINPAFSDGSTNETEIVGHLERVFAGLGMSTARYEPAPSRPSLVATLRGSGGGRSLLLYAHIDTVGVEGMAAPFSAEIRDGRLYGRGAYDMKCGLAACIAAVESIVRAKQTLAGDLMIAAVSDEEVASIGMADVLRSVRTDAAIVTEPTELRICRAHKGFCWIEVETFGRAAHGSRFQDGIDANMRMGRFLARLDLLEQTLRKSAPHPLVGPPSLHAAVMHGGTGTSTYAAHCRLEVERRMIPGETEAQVVGQLQAIADTLAAEDPTFQARVRPTLTRGSFEAPDDSPIGRALMSSATRVLGAAPPVIGEPYWMDASLLADAGIDTIVIGPSGAGAHAIEEWADLRSVEQVAEILAGTAVAYCGGTRS